MAINKLNSTQMPVARAKDSELKSDPNAAAQKTGVQPEARSKEEVLLSDTVHVLQSLVNDAHSSDPEFVAERTEKIESLRAEIESGQYKVNAERIAGNMLKEQI